MRLTGVIDYTMDNFLCIRGFASMFELSEISKADENIQRDLIESHTGEMEAFLSSGKFTFFPEVILGANMYGSESDKEKIVELRNAIYSKEVFRSKKINNIQYSVKNDATSLTAGASRTIIMKFDKASLVGKEFFRIDGNHRLSAVNKDSTYADKLIPFCLMLFSNAEETDKFCRALFYNINTKQIPLRMEENLKVIIESEKTFDDDTLKSDPSFGENYFLTREIIRSVNLSDYPFLRQSISKNKFTYFVEVLKLLLHDKLIEENEEGVSKVVNMLIEINDALENAKLNGIPENLAIISVFSYYKLKDSNKADMYLKWVKKNSLTEISDLHIDDIIRIYDKIYDNLPKKIFISMPFNKKTENTYREVKLAIESISEKYNITIDIIKVDENKDGYTDNINTRIFEGIDNCDLLIADLSLGNKNVHHEIGYAQGKGKKLILLYPNNDCASASSDIGSNLSMYEQLRFDTNEELNTKLVKKIKEVFELK